MILIVENASRSIVTILKKKQSINRIQLKSSIISSNPIYLRGESD